MLTYIYVREREREIETHSLLRRRLESMERKNRLKKKNF